MKRFVLKGGVSLVAAGLLVACAEQRFRLGFESDTANPLVTIVKSAGDTIDVQQTGKISFTVQASDNLGIKTISISIRGGYLLDTAITFTSATTTVNQLVDIPQGINSTAGGLINITATVTDGANNSASATADIFIINLRALTVVLMSPTVGSVTSPDKQIPVRVLAAQQAGIQRVGWQATGVVNAIDSAFYALPDTVDLYDTLTVPTATPDGTFIIFGFAVDSSGRRVSSLPVTVTVQTVVNDTIPPIVSFTVAQRAEVRDSITVRALDPSGIVSLGWIALDGAGNQLSGVTTTSGGTLTDLSVTNTLNLNLTPAQLPALVILKAFATDQIGNHDSARVGGVRTGPVLYDTILVVHGTTRSLPAGGRVVDAIYNRNRNEVYLTNIDLNRLEVFFIGDTTFKTGIPVGSRPWGVALWPKDTVTGANADTVIVANSGGTDFSIVDVSLGLQRRRHPLPAYGVQTVRTVTDPQSGFLQPEITEYHFDDRPEFVGAVCRGGDCTTGGAGDVLAVYSTTPTPGQSSIFSRRGSVRWEKLSDAIDGTTGCPLTPEQHFFWEQAEVGSKSDAADTLAVVSRRCGVETQQLHAFAGIIVTKAELGFLDTTFVRNSGNFARALIGEGGSGSFALAFARAVAYDVNAGVNPDTTTGTGTYALNRDLGVSPDLDVRNQITNTATTLKSIAVNFNGLTNLIRADTVYVLDNNLRLKGLLQIAGPNFGLEVNFNHDFNTNNGLSPSGLTTADRIAFAASPNPQIDVFDTYQFIRIASIPIRDPVIGPLRVARLPSGEQLLIGVTVRGVVTVVLPAITNPFPANRWAGGVP
jgi:hypothetical protein